VALVGCLIVEIGIRGSNQFEDARRRTSRSPSS